MLPILANRCVSSLPAPWKPSLLPFSTPHDAQQLTSLKSSPLLPPDEPLSEGELPMRSLLSSRRQLHLLAGLALCTTLPPSSTPCDDQQAVSLWTSLLLPPGEPPSEGVLPMRSLLSSRRQSHLQVSFVLCTSPLSITLQHFPLLPVDKEKEEKHLSLPLMLPHGDRRASTRHEPTLGELATPHLIRAFNHFVSIESGMKTLKTPSHGHPHSQKVEVDEEGEGKIAGTLADDAIFPYLLEGELETRVHNRLWEDDGRA